MARPLIREPALANRWRGGDRRLAACISCNGCFGPGFKEGASTASRKERPPGNRMDRKKLAVIHIVKKELGLSDEEYRDILEQHAGVRSAKDLDEQGFRRLMRYFVRSRHYRSGRDAITLRQKMFIRHLVSEAGWDEDHFVNFMKKYYKKPTLDSFSKKEASKLIESLKNIIKHREG
jgi:hypothetical protein